MMKLLLTFVFCLVVAETLADNLKCYQCDPVTQECASSKASSIMCGSPQAQCTTQIKKGATDKTMAIRKCVIPDPSSKRIPCPVDYDCTQCTTDLCNSATLAKFAWPTVIVLILTVLYI